MKRSNVCNDSERWCEMFGTIVTFAVFLCIGLFSGVTGNGYLYSKDYGLKYFKNYSPDDYILQPQNWCIVQDHRGIIYAANNGGVLEYDGVSWNTINIPNKTVCSLAIDEAGTIYVGGVNEIGLLSANSFGRLEYISLMKLVEDRKKTFGSVWKIHALEGGIFFRTSKYLFHWRPKLQKMEVVLESKKGGEDRLNGSFICKGKYYVNQRGIGLMQFQKDSFELILGGDTFAFIETIYMIVSYDTSGRELLIGTREKGFFLFNGQTVVPYPTELSNFLEAQKVCYGIRLSQIPGDIAIGTLRGGLVVIDGSGKLKHIFTKNSGLQDNNVKYVYEDTQGNLWAALENGISKIEYSSPLSVYNEDYSRLPGIVMSVTRHSNSMYVGTTQGLFTLSSNSEKFNLVPQISSMCWSLLAIDDSILAATSVGVYLIKNNTIQRITGTPSYVLFRSHQNSNRVWVGERHGLISLYHSSGVRNSEYREEYRFEKIDGEIRTIAEDQTGNLWLGVRPSGVIKVDFNGKVAIKDYSITQYNTPDELPPGEVQVFWASGHVMFGTVQGIFRFDKTENVFIPDTILGEGFSSRLRKVFRLVEDKNKSIWIHAEGRNYLGIFKADHTFDIDEKSLSRIPINAQVNFISPDIQENVTWFATHKGLIRFEPEVMKDYNHEYWTIIRKVLINGTLQFSNITSPVERASRQGTVLAYSKRSLRFEFAAPFFEDETRTKYRYFLEGYDDEPYGWHRVTYKEYTNLDSGLYRFRVQARNVYGVNSREAAFRFRILPPWYRTWWAFLIYALLFLLTIFLTVKWRSRKLEQEKQGLERVITERTKEIQRKSQQLEKQTLLLQEQAEQLKELDHVKSRFFANISHEFRTPLTLIIGPLEQILSRNLSVRVREELSLMHRNSQRLLTLINRLLDLSRIDSGKMKLQAAPLDIISFLRGITASFEQMARGKKQELVFHTDGESISLYFDVEKLEDVFGNLLSNALKFTPEGGKVTVSVKRIEEQEEDFLSGSLEISVQDTGIGIPKEQLSHIFDRFYQVDSKKQKHKGTGIGLALTRELVDLHYGKIDVNSRVGENSGTQFILRFPLGKDHLKPDEIAALSKVGSIPHTVGKEKILKPQGIETVSMENEWEVEWKEDEVIEKETETHTVLVVEDNPDMRKFIRHSIGKPHYTIVEAEDGREGIEKAQTVMPDLIISDIMMPEVDGYELCRTLKENFKTSHIPIILLTAKASERSIVEGLETGADDYITKPFNTTILTTRIKNLIDLRRQLQEKIQRQMLLQPVEIKVSSIDRKFLDKLLEIIEANLDDPDLNVEALSEKMDISRVTLNKKIHALTGEKANEFIRSYRLKRAMQLLKENFGTVLDVAMEVGFSSPSYFSKCFKEKFHQLPSAFLSKEP